MIKKIQQQLIFLEKKIDTLINQSSGKRFEAKRFSKPLQPFERSSYYGKEKQGNTSRERSFTQSRPFDKQQGDEHRGFSQRKKPFFSHRKERI
ncbi:MAG: hypothetical protein NTV71_03700 [Candidatus Omnitrophica bacterium]|nr:hypothetical protein [Candidatus Omnitrophota bacterium]